MRTVKTVKNQQELKSFIEDLKREEKEFRGGVAVMDGTVKVCFRRGFKSNGGGYLVDEIEPDTPYHFYREVKCPAIVYLAARHFIIPRMYCVDILAVCNLEGAVTKDDVPARCFTVRWD